MVVAIIAVVAGAVVAALGGGGSRGPQGAAAVASSVFNLARTEAIMRCVDTFVVVDTTYNSTKPDTYLRRMAVADTNGALIAQWTTLPSSAYFLETLSTPAGTMSLSGQTGSFAYYKFKSNGQLDGGSAKFVVTLGSANGGIFQESDSNKRYGFKIHKMIGVGVSMF